MCIFIYVNMNASAHNTNFTLSLHDALPICVPLVTYFYLNGESGRRKDATLISRNTDPPFPLSLRYSAVFAPGEGTGPRSEEHTSELQSRENLVCRLLLEKKKHEHKKHEE